MIALLVAAAPSPGSSSSTVAIVAIIAGAFVGVIGPLVSARSLRGNTDRTIKAEGDRLTVTLGHEEERLKKTLAAEERRLQDQLSFQRGETDGPNSAGCSTRWRSTSRSFATLWTRSALMAARTAEEAKQENQEYWAGQVEPIRERIRGAMDVAGEEAARLGVRLGAEGNALHLLVGQMRLGGEAVRGFLWVKDGRAEKITFQQSQLRDLRSKFMTEAFKFTETRRRSSAETPSEGTSQGAGQDAGDAERDDRVKTTHPDRPRLMYRPDEAHLKTFLLRRRALSELLEPLDPE